MGAEEDEAVIDTEFRWGKEAQWDPYKHVTYDRDDWLHHWAVEGYFLALSTVMRFANEAEGSLADVSRYTWPYLRDARLYELDPDIVADIYESIEVPSSGSVRAIHAQLPFPSCLLSFGPGLVIDKEVLTRTFEMTKDAGDDIKHIKREDVQVHIFGYLVNHESIIRIITLSEQETADMHSIYVNLAPMRYRREITPRTCKEDRLLELREYVLVVELLRYINRSQQVAVRAGMKHRLEWKKMARGLQLPKHQMKVPPPFYQVTISPKTYIEKVAHGPASKEIEWSHRWDVSGHWCHRIRRGPLPLSEKLRAELTRETKGGNKYQVWTAGEMPPWAKDVLMTHRQPQRSPAEWVAIMRYWRDSYVKGPEDKPYVPASRRLELDA
jgi:hypothetical protein